MLFRPASLESYGDTPDGVRTEHDPGARNTMSEGCAKTIYYGALRGILHSAVTCMNNKGATPEDVQGKIVEIINLFISNSEIDRYEGDELKTWIKDSAGYTEANRGLSVEQDRWPKSYWEIKNKLFSTVSGEVKWERIGKLNDREKQLVEAYHEAQKAFYKAEDALTAYCNDVTIDTIHNVLTKYADTFRKIDESWYNDISRSSKFDFDELTKRRNKNSAEDDNFVDRPVAPDSEY